jgi:DNA-binding MurR/RpiR family transcriptional regulator
MYLRFPVFSFRLVLIRKPRFPDSRDQRPALSCQLNTCEYRRLNCLLPAVSCQLHPEISDFRMDTRLVITSSLLFREDMPMPLQELLDNNQVRLTPAQRRMLRFIMEHYEEAIFLTASQLARKVGVSEATVVRLAQTLGFQGYPAMQKKFREELRSRLSTVTRLEHTVDRIRHEEDVLVKVLQEDIQNLSQTLRDLSLEVFKQAVTEIGAAKRVWVAGLRGAHAPALTLTTYLRFLGKEAYLLAPGHGEVWDILQGLGSQDLVIGISFPRYTRFTIDILAYARRQGARVGALTDSPLSPLGRHAHWVLTAHCRLDSFIESFTAALSVVNALLTAVSIRNPRKTLRILKEREAIWEEKEVYATGSDGD